MRPRPLVRLSVVLSAVLLSTVVPVTPGIAEVAPPEVVAEELDGLPERVSAAADGRRLSEPIETPIPFSMVGLELPPGVDQVEVRARVAGEWAGWITAEVQEPEEGPDATSSEARGEHDRTRLTEAVWLGEADALQLRIPRNGDPADVRVRLIDSLGLSEGIVARVGRYLSARQQPAEASATPFPVVRRSQWGADESKRRGTPSYAPTVKFAVVHHTAGSNSYSAAQAPAVVRGIYDWHVNGNGWDDIGYNFLVDKYGKIYEGRYGGMDRAVVGAQAGGWNSGSTGVSLLGNYNTATPTTAAMNAFRDVIAWKFATHGVDPSPTAKTYVNSQWIPTIIGHRNVRGSYQANPSTTTDCPGQNVYTRMGSLRKAVSTRAGDFSSWVPVTGDWDGNGTVTPGWFRDGDWVLRNSNTEGAAALRFTFGQAGDLPVVGDWNGDGVDTVGVVRDGRWQLRYENAEGPSDRSFWYGRGAVDWPLAGDWTGKGYDSPGIVRDGAWHLRNSLSGGTGDISFTYGRVTRGDLPFVGDWDADGRDTPGIIRDGTWHLRDRHAGGPSDIEFTFGRVSRGDVPIVGDWRGVGPSAIGIVRGSTWHQRDTLTGGTAHRSYSYGWW